MERTDQQNCGTCRYSDRPRDRETGQPIDTHETTGRTWLDCRYNPPVVGNGPNVFPKVTVRSWCGRYEYEDPSDANRHRPAA